MRVDLPIDKPLRRGGYVTNMDGERCWVSSKYERLPTFCFTCGKIGHDEKHCGTMIEKQPLEWQYREWIRVGGTSKGTNEGSKALGSSSHEPKSGGESGKSLKPRWGSRWFPFKVKMKGAVVGAEKTTSKKGKILKNKDMMQGQFFVQQVIRADGTTLVLRSKN